VGLSDLAAMGAEPAWATLALTLAQASEPWLTAFARGFADLSAAQGVALVGGDITRGPLTVTVQVHGFIPPGLAVTRGGARPDDLVCVTGALGDAGLALRRLLAREPVARPLRDRLERPVPRVVLGQALRGLATAMIDVSDGLAADLGHILEASGAGAEIDLSALPLSPAVAEAVAQGGDWALPMASGDDYELCFTLPAGRRKELDPIARRTGVELRVVGKITAGGGLRCLRRDGQVWRPETGGYDHFPG